MNDVQRLNRVTERLKKSENHLLKGMALGIGVVGLMEETLDAGDILQEIVTGYDEFVRIWLEVKAEAQLA